MMKSQSAEWSFNYKSVIELETEPAEVSVVNVAQVRLKVRN